MGKKPKGGGKPPRDLFTEGFDAAKAGKDREAPGEVCELGQEAVETWLQGFDHAVDPQEVPAAAIVTEEAADTAVATDPPATAEPSAESDAAVDTAAPAEATEAAPEPPPAEVPSAEVPPAAEESPAAPEEEGGPEVELMPTTLWLRREIDLTDHELVSVGRSLCENLAAYEEAEADMKASAKRYKERLGQLDKEARGIRRSLESGRGERDIEVVEFISLRRRRKVQRLVDDPSHVLSERPASPSEIDAAKASTQHQAAIPGTETDSAQNVRDFMDSCIVADGADDLARAIAKGRAAARRGKTSGQNPYSTGSLLARRWASGFAEESKAPAEPVTSAPAEEPKAAEDAAQPAEVVASSEATPEAGEEVQPAVVGIDMGDGESQSVQFVAKWCSGCGRSIQAKLEAGEQEFCSRCEARQSSGDVLDDVHVEKVDGDDGADDNAGEFVEEAADGESFTEETSPEAGDD